MKTQRIEATVASILCAVALLAPSASAAGNKPASSVLGVAVGMSLEEAREKIERVAVKAEPARERRTEDEGDDEEGAKSAWSIPDGVYRNIALGAKDARVVWITGFVRPGKEIPFAKLGDLTEAAHASDTTAIWNIVTKDGTRRLVAKGFGGKATVVTILSTDLDP